MKISKVKHAHTGVAHVSNNISGVLYKMPKNIDSGCDDIKNMSIMQITQLKDCIVLLIMVMHLKINT